MRAAVIHPGPHFSVADVHNGWVKGLRECGVDVAEFNLGDRLMLYSQAKIQVGPEYIDALEPEAAVRLAAQAIYSHCYLRMPQLVIIVSGFYIPPETYDILRERGHKVVIVFTESPYEDDAQLARAHHADLNVLNDPTNLDRFKTVAPTVYMPHAYDPAVHYVRPPRPALESDFFFCGTGFPSRIDFLEQCDFTGLDARLAGNWANVAADSPLRPMLVNADGDCMNNTDAAERYASTYSSVNLYRTEGEYGTMTGWSMGPREVELAACGTFFLRDPRPEGDGLLPMLPTFDGPGDFSEKLHWWVAHDDERVTAAGKAREAIQDRTFARNAAELLRTLGY